MHLGHEFLKTGDFVDICVIKTLPFVQSVGLPDAEAMGWTRDRAWLRLHELMQCPP
jgi:hypothetical protein